MFDLVELTTLHFTSKLNNISQLDYLFGISNEKGLGDEARALFVQLRLHQLMEVGPVGLLAHLVALMLVWCRFLAMARQHQVIYLEPFQLQ